MRRHVVIWTSPTGATRWDLARDATVRLPRRRGATVVRAERGTVLVTREGDREDHVLGPGEELVLPRRGVAVAWAFTDAAISTQDAAPGRGGSVAARHAPLKGATS
jgi:hypothetical protein